MWFEDQSKSRLEALHFLEFAFGEQAFHMLAMAQFGVGIFVDPTFHKNRSFAIHFFEC